MQGVALALGLGIGYSILVTVFGKLGEAELLPPVVGAWAPVLLGLLFAVNRMTTLRDVSNVRRGMQPIVNSKSAAVQPIWYAACRTQTDAT